MQDEERHKKMAEQDEAIRQTLGGVKNKLLVLSGKGGVGKSTVAVNLAVAFADRGFKVGLMDVDLHGPSVPRLLGLADLRASFDGEHILPVRYSENLDVVSIENLLAVQDNAVIWRGPLKIGAIRQFLADVKWGELDYLIIDSPPGTGDEPLSVAQTVTGVKAVVVTTPQELSLADVRKSINFCRAVNMPVLGVIENMSGYVCPECGHREDLFRTGGGERMAVQMGVPFLGRIPIEPEMVVSGDLGQPYLAGGVESPAASAFSEIVKVITGIAEAEPEKVAASLAVAKEEGATPSPARDGSRVIAIPTAGGRLCAHFGHCEHFALIEVNGGKIAGKKMAEPPAHEPGVLPRWLKEQGASIVIAGGMGSRAQGFFSEYGIEVIVGAPSLAPEEVVERYLAGDLEAGNNICDH